jgi:predicted dehydrogenase
MTAPARIAIIGCGNISSMHLEGLVSHADRAVAVAAVDPSAERREWVRTTWGVEQVFASTDELLAATTIDAAIVSTPSNVRLEAVRSLAEAGVAVLVEKPLADTMAEAFAIAELAEKTGTVIGVDQNFRDHYAFGLARDVIKAGEIGAVYAIDQSELVFREVQGWRAQSQHHALAVMGVHWFDGFRYLLPADADWIVSRTYRSPATPAAGETDAFTQIHFGNATVNYSQSFSSRIERIETIVFGESGTLRLDYESLTVSTATGVRTLANPYAGDGKPQSAYRCLEHVLDAAENGTEAANSVADNLKTLSLLVGAYRSAELGAPVTFEGGILR